MAISTSSIFHFTPSYTNLISILESGFNISYCLEEYDLADGTVSIGVPMVSFSDIPLSHIVYSSPSYGQYCIGLTKEWASLKKINPVLYLEPNSYLSEIIFDFIRLASLDYFVINRFNIFGDSDGNPVHIDATEENENKHDLYYALLSYSKNSN